MTPIDPNQMGPTWIGGRRHRHFQRGDVRFGPFGGPFGGGPMFGGGPGRGRKRRGDVRAALLILLAEEPRNGYQLMQIIEERSGGRWRPSPGSVYPALQQLEDEGFVKTVQSDSGRTFEITDAGREHLEARGEHAPPWEADDDHPVEAVHELKHLIIGIGKATWQVAQVGDEQQIKRAAELLAEARRGIYRILAEDEPAESADEQV